MTDKHISAQAGLIGCVMIDNTLAGRLLTETAASEYDSAGKSLYLAIGNLFRSDKPTDVITLDAETNHAFQDYLTEAMDLTPSAAMFDHYVSVLKSEAKKARIQSILSEAATCDDLDEISKMISKINEAMLDTAARSATSMEDLMLDFFERKHKKERYLDYGVEFQIFNKYLKTKPGHMNIIGARTSVGKTAFALQLASNLAKKNRVGYFSFEGNIEDLADRLVAYRSCVYVDRIQDADRLSDSDWKMISNAAAALSALPFDIVDASGYSVDDVSILQRRNGMR